MNRTSAFALALSTVFAAIVSGQTTQSSGQAAKAHAKPTLQKPTRIGQHQMGETAQQWLDIHNPLEDLDSICRSAQEQDKTKCENLQNLRDGNESIMWTKENGRDYVWTFVHGKLSEVMIMADYEKLYFEQEFSFLTQIYGKPSDIVADSYHNGFGAQWKVRDAYWKMPDGTLITELENSEFSNQGVVTAIEFVSKEAQQERLRKPSKPNPYQQ